MYKPISQKDIVFFASVVGADNVITSKDNLNPYSHDETEDLVFMPEAVIKPANVYEVSTLMRYCNQELIPVTPRGAGTGLSGGALAVCKGVVLSTERLNQILNIDERNHQVTTEPGVITQVLQETVAEKGLFYPVDPASKGSCFIGGNISENSGGPKAVKYGVVKDYVLNLEVVLPNGDIIWTGANTLKNATGYNLTQLIVGSEGTLGIVTKIVLKLLVHPIHTLLMLVNFKDVLQACTAVNAIFIAGVVPSAIEFMERDAIDWVLKYVPDIHIDVQQDVQAHLLIEVDGNNPDMLQYDMEKIYLALKPFDIYEPFFADTTTQKETLWKMRRSVAEAVKRHSVYKEEDTVVMRAELPALLKGVKEIGKQYGFKSVCYGHAGDGNLHVNIIKGEATDEMWQNQLPSAISEIFTLCKKLGGTISGEHGIGFVQKKYMDIVFTHVELNLMRSIKHVFDPNYILNPGKIFPN